VIDRLLVNPKIQGLAIVLMMIALTLTLLVVFHIQIADWLDSLSCHTETVHLGAYTISRQVCP
jgi:hypothetical protein